jgi:ribosomal protein S24E
MEMKILKQQKNPFLHREEFELEISSVTTPSYAEVSKELGKNQELTLIKSITGNFGRHIFNSEAFVYDSKEAKAKIEKISRKERKKIAEAAKAAALSAPQAQAPATK